MVTIKPITPLFFAATASLVFAAPEELAGDLFSKSGGTGWEFVSATPMAAGAVSKVGADGIVAISGKPAGYLAAKEMSGDCRLHFEWRWPAGAAKNCNGGVLLDIAGGPVNGTPWPVCFQVQLKMDHVGDLLPMASARFAGALSTAPDAKTPQLDRKAGVAEKPVGEWNEGEVIRRGGGIEVRINGVLANQVSGCTPADGALGFQLEGAPFDLRNVTLTALPKAP